MIRLRRSASVSPDPVGAASGCAGDAGDSPRARRRASMYDARSPSIGLGATAGAGASAGAEGFGSATSASGLGSAISGGAGFGFVTGRGGARGGDARATTGGGDGADDGDGTAVGLGSSCTASAPLCLPMSALNSDRLCKSLGSYVHRAAIWTSSDRTNATQISGIVTTSCRLLPL